MSKKLVSMIAIVGVLTLTGVGVLLTSDHVAPSNENNVISMNGNKDATQTQDSEGTETGDVTGSEGNKELTEKEQRIREHDLLVPKNIGAFDQTTNPIPTEQIEGQSIYAIGGEVKIVQEPGDGKENYVAQVPANTEVNVYVEGLESNTEYTIFFKAKPEEGATTQFRLSGFKDDDEEGHKILGGLANQISNLGINDATDWNVFRYDFETGSGEANHVYAKFRSMSGDSYVDDVFIVKREVLGELTANHELPPNDELSRGHRILIDQGLQLQSWITTDTWEEEKGWLKQPELSDILDMGFTAVQYNDKPNFSEELHEEADQQGVELKWATAWGPKYSHISSNRQDGKDGRVGLPTDEEWDQGYLTPEMGVEYLDDLVSMCIGDEENYSDTLIQNLKSWYEVIRKHYETEDRKILLHHNEVGNTPPANIKNISTFSENMLRKYVQAAKPDMITYDMYYFRERRIDQTQGGSVLDFYNDLNRYRIVAKEGIDGTGEQPIPFGQYTYAWRTGPGAGTPSKRGDGWYELTESQINLYSFGTWTFGGKWMSNFRWLDDNASYLFSDYRVSPDGTYGKYHIYDQFKEMIRQSKNLGPHLVRIQNEEVAIIRGKHTNNQGTVTKNSKPKDNPDWSKIKDSDVNQKVFITDIQVQNLGEQNDGLNGDVFISYFNPLNGLTTEDKQVFTSADPRYFMLLNGLTSGDGLPAELQQGSSYETRQEVTVTFELPDASYKDKLKKVSRVDGGDMLQEQGKVVQVPLTHKGGNTYEMKTVIGGGYADLFYWELGEVNATTHSQLANEVGKESQMIGDIRYTNPTEARDLDGRTVTIGHIKGTNDMPPDARLGYNINRPKEGDLVEGKVINLNNYPTAIGNMTAIGSRYYAQDIWHFRLDQLEEDNNVSFEFKEYDWTKQELIEYVKAAENGDAIEDMPDLLVVPNEWLWEQDNLIDEEVIVPMTDFNTFDWEARKWNDAVIEMASQNGETYGASIDLSTNPTGMFVNKTLLPVVGTSSVSNNGIYTLQEQDRWTFDELNTIIDTAIEEKISSKEGIKLFADNEQLIRQLLVSSGVDMNPKTFDAACPEYKVAIDLYMKLEENDLLFEGTLDEQMEAFSENKIIFLVAPYEDVAQHLAHAYWIYEDNLVRYDVDNYGGKWGAQSVMGPPQGEGWQVTLHEQPQGKYAMPMSDWNFMLFPKPSIEDDYRAIINNVSYPVMLSSTKDVEDIAFLWNELAEEYKGVDTIMEVLKKGGIAYPEGRGIDPIPKNMGDATSKDEDTLRKVALRDGYGDNMKASGAWDEVLLPSIIEDPYDFEAINQKMRAFENK